MLRLGLPPTDGAHGLFLSKFLSEPFTLDFALIGAVFFGCVSFPFAYFALRDLRRVIAGPFVLGAVLLEIVLVTLFWSWAGLFGRVGGSIDDLQVFGLADFRARQPRRLRQHRLLLVTGPWEAYKE